MENSFIPKKNFSDKKNLNSYRSFFLLVAVFVFSLMVLVSIGVFFYKSFLKDEISNKNIILEREKGNLELDLIQKISRFDKKLAIATTLLENHLTLVPLFDFLEENTLKEVMYEEFSFENSKGVYFLRLSGKALDYSSVALQSDIFGESKDLIEPIFSDLGVNNEGRVVFSVEMKVDPKMISYKDNFKEE